MNGVACRILLVAASYLGPEYIREPPLYNIHLQSRDGCWFIYGDEVGAAAGSCSSLIR